MLTQFPRRKACFHLSTFMTAWSFWVGWFCRRSARCSPRAGTTRSKASFHNHCKRSLLGSRLERDPPALRCLCDMQSSIVRLLCAQQSGDAPDRRAAASQAVSPRGGGPEPRPSLPDRLDPISRQKSAACSTSRLHRVGSPDQPLPTLGDSGDSLGGRLRAAAVERSEYACSKPLGGMLQRSWRARLGHTPPVRTHHRDRGFASWHSAISAHLRVEWSLSVFSAIASHAIRSSPRAGIPHSARGTCRRVGTLDPDLEPLSTGTRPGDPSRVATHTRRTAGPRRRRRRAGGRPRSGEPNERITC